jgi:aromatic ring-opening dioxygenase catalytic subunit (LigB family)
VESALSEAGIPCVVELSRGLDHGAWVPLSLLRPAGDRPVLQLSLDTHESPAAHVALGRALAPLRDQGVLLLGSGGVTHNQEVFRRGYFSESVLTQPEPFSREFDAWVTDLVTGRAGEERTLGRERFQEHALARIAHPTVEHFLPLLVLAGAAGTDRGTKVFEGFQHSLSTSAFRFG